VYDAQDRVTSYAGCTYAYKPDGSLQTKTCGASTTSYDYDTFGNLRRVTLPNATNIDYIIDGQNRRIGKKVNNALVEGFLYRNQLQPAVWLNASGTVKATFVYGPHANVPEYMVQGTTTYRLITDQVGSVRLVVNTATGAVAERIDYDEFGNVLADSAPGTQPFGFAGGLRDVDTGLTRLGARDYDPLSGRWTGKEPLGFEGSNNFFQYANGDPINFYDPSGLAATAVQKVIVITISDQMLRAYENGHLKYEFETVTGDQAHPTTVGDWSINRKEAEYTSKTYGAQMNYAMFFHKGEAIHQYHGPFTLDRLLRQVSSRVGSHGCARLEEDDARALFDWAPIGTHVRVRP
jgi:RHS repeat-associated protein